MFKNKKNILIIVFIILGLYVILDFRDHNFKRAIDACVAGSNKLDQPMTKEEAKNFVKNKSKKKNKYER